MSRLKPSIFESSNANGGDYMRSFSAVNDQTRPFDPSHKNNCENYCHSSIFKRGIGRMLSPVNTLPQEERRRLAAVIEMTLKLAGERDPEMLLQLSPFSPRNHARTVRERSASWRKMARPSGAGSFSVDWMPGQSCPPFPFCGRVFLRTC